MTPQQCLETRLRLGWTREDLASACSLAAPIVRLFEAGALDDFDDCRQAIEAALAEAEARAPVRASAGARVCGKRHGALAEAGRRWRGPQWSAVVTA